MFERKPVTGLYHDSTQLYLRKNMFGFLSCLRIALDQSSNAVQPSKARYGSCLVDAAGPLADFYKKERRCPFWPSFLSSSAPFCPRSYPLHIHPWGESAPLP
jgi:hypothetical protein